MCFWESDCNENELGGNNLYSVEFDCDIGQYRQIYEQSVTFNQKTNQNRHNITKLSKMIKICKLNVKNVRT